MRLSNATMIVKKVIICFLFIPVKLFAQPNAEMIDISYRYDFIVADQPNQFLTIRQNIANTQSGYRLFSKKSRTDFSSLTNFIVQTTSLLLVIIPFEQANSYRAVLTFNKIGSTYHPFSLISIPEPSITGLTDKQLAMLKEENTNQFTRLYSVGIESNYLWLNKMEQNIFFGNEDLQNVKYDYIIRKILSYSYHLPSLLPGLSSSITNNGAELDQRITNINIYSYARSIFNDTSAFKRNVEYADLSDNEKNYLRRVAFLSFLNLVSNFTVGVESISLSPSTKMAFSLSQLLSPLGEVYCQDFWFKNGRGLKSRVTFRQIINNEKIFPGAFFGLYDMKLRNTLRFDLSANIWTQPEHLSFKDKKDSFGGSTEVALHYLIKPRKTSNIKLVAFDFSALYKSRGFVPSILDLREQLIISAGFSLNVL